MNVRTYSLGGVPSGSRQSLRVEEHDKTLSVISDGRLDAPMMDGFHSAGAVQSVRDPRLQSLRNDAHSWFKGHMMREWEYDEDKAARLKTLADLKAAGKDDFQGIILQNLGPSWKLSRSEVRCGGSGSLTATLKEGDQTLGVTVDRYRGDGPDLPLWSPRLEGDFRRSHVVSYFSETDQVVESAYLVDRRVPVKHLIGDEWLQ